MRGATRIAVLFRTTDQPWGGGNAFLRSLVAAWRRRGVEVTGRLDRELVGVLINSSYKGKLARLTPAEVDRMVRCGFYSRPTAGLGLSRWRRGSRPPFVHRLDGVFRLYGRPTDDPADVDQLAINRFADWTVYQSEFCRTSFEAEGADVSRSTVVMNGVDLEVFYPARTPPAAGPLRLVAIAWSPNRRKGGPDVARASLAPGVEVTFVGNWPAGVDPARVRVVPPQGHAALSDLLRGHHALLHMAQNDPCSNAVLEAMACGLPVIYHPSGGNPEIVGNCGVACAEDLEAPVTQLRDRYGELRERTLARRADLSVERAADAYLDVFARLGPVSVG